MGANSKLGAFSNNYGTSSFGLLNCHLTVGIDLWSIQLNVLALMWNKIKFS